MILLDRQTMMPHKRFAPESMSLTLEERKSSASIQLGPDDPEIAVGAWLTDDSGPGAGIVWRAKTVDEQFDTGTRTVTLEHIINTLKDDVIFGEFTYEDIAGEGATGCYAHQMVSFILDQQSIWQLGDFDYMEVTNPYKFDDVTLFSALETITGSLEDAYWAYDMSTFPFTLHIKHIPNEVTCEMRPGRNIQTMKRTIDRSRMYTRLFPIGKDDLNITGDYLSKNEEIYGTICAIKTDQKYETENELLGWAQDLLNRHCEPTVTITISGLELSESTGEPLDHLTLMRKCRVPLPEFGTTIAEKITKLQWSNVVKEPEKVTVTLGNEMEDIASIINSTNEAVSGGGGGSTDAKNAGEDHAWFVDTDTHVQMIAEAIIGKDEDGVNWSRVASITVDGEGIHQRVTRALGYMVVMDAKIDLNEERLRAEFEDVTASLRSELQMSAASLRIEFTDEANGLRGELQMSAASLRVEFEDSNASLRSELQMTAASLRVTFENETDGLRSELQMSAASLRTEFTNADAGLRSEFEITAGSIRSTIANEVDGLQSQITQNAGKISLVVTEDDDLGNIINTAGIIAAINNDSTSSMHIDADNVYIGNQKSTTVIAGKLNVSDLKAKIGEILILEVLSLQSTGSIMSNGAIIGASLAINQTYGITNSGMGGFSSIKLGSATSSFSNCIVSAEVTNSGATLKLTDAEGTEITFSRAASVSGDWSGTTFTATASPTSGSSTASTSVHLALEGSPNPNATVYAKVYKDNPSVAANQLDSIQMTLTENVSAKTVTLVANTLTKGSVSTANTWTAGETSGKATGWSNAYGKVSWPTQNTSSNQMTVKAPASSEFSTPNQSSVTYTVSTDNDYAYIKAGSIVMARCANTKDIAVTDLTLWDGTGSSANQLTSNISLSPGDSQRVIAYCRKGGSWMSPGTDITISAAGTAFSHPSDGYTCMLYYLWNGTRYEAGRHKWYWI